MMRLSVSNDIFVALKQIECYFLKLCMLWNPKRLTILMSMELFVISRIIRINIDRLEIEK
jgi:hypothetical protein